MFINSITISAFGKLKNCTFEFKNGINLLRGPNEAGKTTLLEFIKFIFYGMNLRKKNGELSFKEKYLPWDGSPACGNLTFTGDDGNEYVISRIYSKEKSKVEVFDAATGEKINNIDVKKIGEYFLGLGEEAFSSTAFLSALSASIKADKEGELVRRLTNISESGLENISFTNALNKLKEDVLNLSSERRKNAVIPSLKAEISELDKEIFDCNKKIMLCDDLKKRIDDFNDEITELKNQKEKLTLNNMNMSKAQNDDTKTIESEISTLEKSNFLKYSSISDEEINFVNQNSDVRKSEIRLCIFMILSVLGGLIISVFSKNILVTLSFFFALFAFFIIHKININKNSLKVKNILSKYNCTDIDEFKNGVKLCEGITLKIQMLKDELNILKKEKLDVAESKNISNDFTIDEFNDKIVALDVKINDLTRNVLLNEEELKMCLYSSVKLNELKKHKEVLQNKLIEANKKVDALNFSCEILQKAFNDLKKQFSPQLAKAASNVLSEITDGKYKEVYTDDEFRIKLMSDFNFNDSLFYSRGTYEQIYFSMRIALLSIAVYDKKLPLFIDDAFGFYDDDRFINALKFILNESLNRQVFISSCRSNEYIYFRNEDVNIIELCSERND